MVVMLCYKHAVDQSRTFMSQVTMSTITIRNKVPKKMNQFEPNQAADWEFFSVL